MSGPPADQTIRLAHLSDIHFGGENPQAVAAAAAHIAAHPVDLTIISGDLTRYGETAEFDAALRWLETVPGPRLLTPGNHDAPYIAWAERIVAPFRRYERSIGPARSDSHSGPGLAVRTVNTARGAQPRLNWSKGQISQRQIRETASWLSAAPQGLLKVLVCHHPLTEMVGGPMTARVWNGETAARVFAEAKADLVLSGHIHAPFTWTYPHGDMKTYAVGAGTLSIRERGVPPSFNMLEVTSAEIRVSALAWTGSHYEPYRTWSLDRR